MGLPKSVLVGLIPIGTGTLNIRTLATTPAMFAIRDRIVWKKDLNKRPSDLEIKKKKLPPNTPTLGERLKRDKHSPFFTLDRHNGYYKGLTGTWRDVVDPDQPTTELVKESFSQLKLETTKWVEELKYIPLDDAIKRGEVRDIYTFKEQKDWDQWICTCDSTWGEGYSTADLKESLSKGRILFSGELSTRVPQDGRTQFAGYANMKATNRLKSFARVQPLGLDNFDCLIFKYRGDGRTYKVNLHIEAEYDIHYNDLWSYPLYTRGGPYWQTTVIQFSKFLLTSRGVIQDELIPVPKDEVVAIGITLSDNISGPFSFELDSIKGKCDPSPHREKNAYEEYKFPRKNYNMP